MCYHFQLAVHGKFIKNPVLLHATCATPVCIALRRLAVGVSVYKCIGKSDKKKRKIEIKNRQFSQNGQTYIALYYLKELEL